jgi:2-furoyl-CoA dehydrogenase large subunit
VRGALAQAFGSALYENFAYGADGSLLSGTFADYLLPTAMEIPPVTLLHLETPSPFTPLGAKGMGEGNMMSTPVCLANALADALQIRDVPLPMIPSRIAALLHGEEQAPPRAVARPQAPAGGRGVTGSASTLVPAPRETIWNALLDPKILSQLIPGCESLQAEGPATYRVVARAGVGPVRGSFTAVVKFTDLVPPAALSFQLEASGPLGSSSGTGRARLEAENGGTRVHYEYSIDISGKVAAVGGRMLEGAARILIGAFFEALARQAGGEPASTAETTSSLQKLLHWLRIAP